MCSCLIVVPRLSWWCSMRISANVICSLAQQHVRLKTRTENCRDLISNFHTVYHKPRASWQRQMHSCGKVRRTSDFKFFTEFQSHEAEFDYLKSLEIEEKINAIKWCPRVNDALFLLATNGEPPARNYCFVYLSLVALRPNTGFRP